MTWVHWQCSQNISWVSIEKGLLGPIGGRCGGNDGRGGSMAGRGGGCFAKRSIDLNDERGGGGFVVLGGRSRLVIGWGDKAWYEGDEGRGLLKQQGQMLILAELQRTDVDTPYMDE
ncbi:hypothetical protein Tco_0640124 [Tanacetum coccineum]